MLILMTITIAVSFYDIIKDCGISERLLELAY